MDELPQGAKSLIVDLLSGNEEPTFEEAYGPEALQYVPKEKWNCYSMIGIVNHMLAEGREVGPGRYDPWNGERIRENRTSFGKAPPEEPAKTTLNILRHLSGSAKTSDANRVWMADLAYHLAWRGGLLLADQKATRSRTCSTLLIGVGGSNGPGMCVEILLEAWGDASPALALQSHERAELEPHDLMLCPDPLTPALFSWDIDFQQSMRDAMLAAAEATLHEMRETGESGTGSVRAIPPRLEPTKPRLTHVMWSVSSLAIVDDGPENEGGLALDEYGPPYAPQIQRKLAGRSAERGVQRLPLGGPSGSASLFWAFYDLFHRATARCVPLLAQMPGYSTNGPRPQPAADPGFDPVEKVSQKLKILSKVKGSGFAPDLDRVFVKNWRNMRTEVVAGLPKRLSNDLDDWVTDWDSWSSTTG